ncbi:putative quinol monooxygenase [Caulobacter sp. Root343]|uniref:putative quinol monooxygenase n=1 Tax=Caulobacter sp. Root343 TaxID=1736520 RepID=UPI0006FF03A1|nr:putative quinol monooxygenase [Caulobacter sp. Root343]KQV64106.1 antibiotic biosynthesis monooxygenase [Caulobacter sp. Root343]
MNVTRKISAILTAKPGRAGDLEALLTALAASSRAEPGNLRWDIWKSCDDANVFVLDELYEDESAVLTHRATAHFKDYLSKISDLADRVAIVSKPLDATSSVLG